MGNSPPLKRKAISGKAANHDNAQSSDITLLNKYLAVMFASTDRRLSGGDIAVLLQLLDYFNPRKGYAYPNMDTLAFNTNRTKRTIVDCIARLQNLGYLKIVRHGNRTTSNRYLPTFHEYVRPTKLDGDLDTMVQPNSPYIVQSAATIGAFQRNELVQCTSLNTTYETAQQAGDIGGGVVITPPAAALPSPEGASQLTSKNQNAIGLKYPEFWAAYPKRQNVSAANAEIASALARGVSMVAMVEAALQYAIWIKAQPWQDKDQYTKGATNFIKQECWLEDYTVKSKVVKAKVSKVKATKAAKPKRGKIAKKPVEKKPTYPAKSIAQQPKPARIYSSDDCSIDEILEKPSSSNIEPYFDIFGDCFKCGDDLSKLANFGGVFINKDNYIRGYLPKVLDHLTTIYVNGEIAVWDGVDYDDLKSNEKRTYDFDHFKDGMIYWEEKTIVIDTSQKGSVGLLRIVVKSILEKAD